MKSDKYMIDAVILRDEVSVGGVTATPVSILGFGMRQALPMLLEIISLCGSYAICVAVSEIETTVTVPRSDAARVMCAIAAIISREPRVPAPHSKGSYPRANMQTPYQADINLQKI